MNCRKFARWLGGVALLGAVALVLAFLGAGHFLAAPSQPPAKADLMFALGGDHGGRVNGVLDLYRKGYAPRVLLGAEGLLSPQGNLPISWVRPSARANKSRIRRRAPSRLYGFTSIRSLRTCR